MLQRRRLEMDWGEGGNGAGVGWERMKSHMRPRRSPDVELN